MNESMCRGGSDPGAEAPVATADAVLVAPPSATPGTKPVPDPVLDSDFAGTGFSPESVPDLDRSEYRFQSGPVLVLDLSQYRN